MHSPTLADNTRYVLRRIWEWDRRTLWMYALRVPVDVARKFFPLWMVRVILDAVERGVATTELTAQVCALTAALAALTYVHSRLQSLLWWNADAVQNRYIAQIQHKRMTMEYERLLSREGQQLLARAKGATAYWGAACNQCVGVLSELATGLASVVLYGGVLLATEPWLIPVLAATTAASAVMMRRARDCEQRARPHTAPLQTKLDYLIARAGDEKNAKDIRLYGLSGAFLDVFRDALGRRMAWYRKTTGSALAGRMTDALAALLRDGIGYAVLLRRVCAGTMTAGDFVFRFGIIGGFSAWLNQMAGKLNEYRRISLDITDLRAFLELPDRPRLGEKSVPTAKTHALTLENVTYRYPDAARDALRNVNLTIRAGERLALVGENGAGKTTLVCLLCGLLTPTAGRVLLDGVDVREYAAEAVFAQFAAVFQNMDFLPLSIAENVALTADFDRERLDACLRAAGLAEKVAALPHGADTRLVGSVHADATALSGGETQKLALARALYRDASVLILDEPTAKLDPIAESELYARYAALTEGKTSVYISHRLASTRFCDRVVLLRDGAIAETGTHAELLRAGGAYADMFEKQSHYYRMRAMERSVFG